MRQRRVEHRVRPDPHRDHRVRRVRPQPHQRGGQQCRRSADQGAHDELAGAARLHAVQSFGQVAQLGQKGRRMLFELGTKFGQGNAPLAAHKECAAEQLFELVHRLAHRRLAHCQLARSGKHRARLDDAIEDQQLLQAKAPRQRGAGVRACMVGCGFACLVVAMFQVRPAGLRVAVGDQVTGLPSTRRQWRPNRQGAAQSATRTYPLMAACLTCPDLRSPRNGPPHTLTASSFTACPHPTA